MHIFDASELDLLRRKFWKKLSLVARPWKGRRQGRRRHVMKTLNYSMTKMIYVLAGVVLLVGMSEGGGVYAAETKKSTYHAAMCESYSKDAEVTFSRNGVLNYGRTRNAEVICPIPNTLQGGKLSYVFVDVRDNSASGSIRCTVQVRGRGSHYRYTYYNVSSDSDRYVGGRGVYFPNLRYDGLQNTDYSMNCVLPKWNSKENFSYIHSYTVTETK